MKRTHLQVRKSILNALADSKEHAYGEIERKANTNWETVRDHCKEMEIYGFVVVSDKSKGMVTNQGLEILKKLKEV